MAPGERIIFTGARPPGPVTLRGRYVTVRPLDPAADGEALFRRARDPDLWTHLPYGPFARADEYLALLTRQAAGEDPRFFTFVTIIGPVGVGSLLRIVPEHGTIEIGHLLYTPFLQRTPAGTEAISLLAGYAFDTLGYRRLEWKCDALNRPSRMAALRHGFLYEGTFAQHMVVKGRNRDTAWFAITDTRWPEVRAGFQRWLDPANFDLNGEQLARLQDLRGG